MVSAGDFEDEEHREFIRLEQNDGSHVVVSRAAFEVSAFATAASIRHDTPGVILDSYLDADTSLDAVELVSAGIWERIEGGYRIADSKEREFVERLHREQVEPDNWPKTPDECPEHMEGPNSRGRCCRCGTPIPPEDRIF